MNFPPAANYRVFELKTVTFISELIFVYKRNLDQTLQSGFSIEGVESTSPRVTQRTERPVIIGLNLNEFK